MKKQPAQQVIAAIKPITAFIQKEINSGIVLILATVLAMVIANSPWADTYFKLFEKTYISIDFQIWSLSKPLYYWINDGLMAIFFFMIGLEVKRELLIGELSTVRKAMLPFFAAIGGMLVPALVFFFINRDNPEYIDGWAIPMATDIAFALGILALLKSKAPTELKLFLTSLAIVDDLGAVLTIAVFYTEEIATNYLLIAGGAWGLLFLLNALKVRITWLYLVIGVLGVWYPLLMSGVHATIAGVMVALTIPLWRKVEVSDYIAKVKSALEQVKDKEGEENNVKLNATQYDAVEDIKLYSRKVSSPHQILEHNIHDFTLYFIMPLFAFANTGIRLDSVDVGGLIQPLTLGIFAGLVIGKVIGIGFFVWIGQRLKLVTLPPALNWGHIIGGGFLAGIGFTMSIFITELAFHGDELITLSKVSILVASIVAGAIGFGVIWFLGKSNDVEESVEVEEIAPTPASAT